MNLITVIIVALIGALFLFDITTVIMSYAFSWYEKANQHPDLLHNRGSAANLRLLTLLFFAETLFNLLTIATIPFGCFNFGTPQLKQKQTPILLLHGLFVNQACWFWFKMQLRARGYDNIGTLNLSSWHSEEALTEVLAKRIDELRIQTGVNQVFLIGHSMGGIIARNYIQLRGGADKVCGLVCLGSPHLGSKLAVFTAPPLGKILIPSSDFLKRLNTAPAPKQIPVTNIYTRQDNMIIPNHFSELPWATNVILDNMGHTSLLYRTQAIDATSQALQQVLKP